ncbi:MAG: malate synthase G, partial [Burkholderiales bacterium]|nr:malate synthase G [Burkholderiales bacterium]
MTARTPAHGLQVATSLHRFIEEQVLPGTGVDSAAFWQGFDAIVHDLAPKNAALLAERERLQTELDRWHRAYPGPIRKMAKYRAFLEKIGYLVPVPASVKTTTRNVDAELALQAGPQLVVPITNARYALNAANARWGSLYDALYGTDALPEDKGASKVGPDGKGYNPVRGARVIEFARQFLDGTIPLVAGSHRDAIAYTVAAGTLAVTLRDGTATRLSDSAQLLGWRGNAAQPQALVFRHHGLRFEIVFDAADAIGRDDPAHVKDIVLEAAVTTIIDFEDSIAAVDADDKVAAYHNWLGLMRGSLMETFDKGGKPMTRR